MSREIVKKLTLCLIAVVTMASMASAIGPLSISANGRYLQSGTTPFFLNADAAWSLTTQLTYAQADIYLTDRANRGFNGVLVNLIEHHFSNHAPANIYNVSPWTGSVFATPNEPYFALVDSMINRAQALGICVFLDPIYLGSDASQGWQYEASAASYATMKAWGRYVGNRYKNFSNIVWVMGADMNPTTVTNLRDKVDSMVAGMKAADTVYPGRLYTTHSERNTQAWTHWPESWVTLNNIYSHVTNLVTFADAAYSHSPTMPFFLIEGDYEGEGPTQQQVRAQAYWTILRGGAGHIFGNCPIWAMGTTVYPTCGTGFPVVQSALSSNGSQSMTYFRNVVLSRHWTTFLPDLSAKVLTAGASSGTSLATFAYTSDSTSILGYLPTRRSVTINPGVLKGDSITVTWLNPSTGVKTPASTVTKISRSYTPPTAADWVMIIDGNGVSIPVPIPIAPILATPALGASGISTSPTMTWNASTYATSYRVQLSVDPAFGSTVVDQSGITGVSFPVSGLASSTIYYWRVNAANATGTSAYSTIWNFTTSPPSQGGSTVSFCTLGSSTASRLVTAGYTYMSYARCDSTGFLDSLIVPMHNNWDGNDAVFGIIYTGTSGDIGAFVARSRDTVVVNNSTLTPYVLHFTPGTVPLSATTVYYIGIHSISSSGYVKVGATSNTTSRTGYDLDAAPPDNPWGLTEFTNQNQIDMVAFYHTGSSSTPPSAPILSLPNNGASSASVTPDLSWTASIGAASYRIQVSGSAGFGTTVVDQNNLVPTTLSITGLVNNTTYFWRGSATNNGGTSVYSTVWSFTTVALGTSPVPPSLSSPTNGATLIATAPTLAWSASTGATSYRMQLSVDPAFGSTVVDQSGITGVSFSVSGLASSTIYYWRVDAANAIGTSAFSTIWNFTTSPPSQGGSTVSFRTLGSSTASRLVTAGYTYMSYARCDSTGFLDSLIVPMHNNWDGNDAVFGIIYTGTSGDIGAFVARSRDTVVVNNSTLTPYVLHFTPGTVPLSATTVYYIGIHSISSSGYVKVGATSNTTSRTGYDLDATPPDNPWALTEYTNQNEIDMVAYYHTGGAAFALPGLNQDELKKENILPTQITLSQNYPNPFNPTTRIDFSLTTPGRVTLEIYNMLGQKVKTLVDGNMEVGNHYVQWNTVGDNGRQVSSGIYLYRLSTGGHIETKKMLLLK